MHRQENRQGTIWLLSGTGDGPRLAASLISGGWHVHVSVVSEMAAQPYQWMDVEHVHVGALGGSQGISRWLQRIPVDWVVDATHPFAVRISNQLNEACLRSGQRLVRFERPKEAIGKALVINSIADLVHDSLAGRRVMIALGVRQLVQASNTVRQAGGIVFARVLPSAQSLIQASAAGVRPDHLAVVRPLQGAEPGAMEAALCRHFAITDVVGRQSGGSTEAMWAALTEKMDLKLWLLRRPDPIPDVKEVHGVNQLLAHLRGPSL